LEKIFVAERHTHKSLKNEAIGDGGCNLTEIWGNFSSRRAMEPYGTMWSQGASPIHVAHVVNAPQSPEDNPVAKCLEASACKCKLECFEAL